MLFAIRKPQEQDISQNIPSNNQSKKVSKYKSANLLPERDQRTSSSNWQTVLQSTCDLGTIQQ
jgi:hypothetical protein